MLILFQAFGWEPPKFAHLPLILNADGTKLSKRQKDIHMEHYKEQGFDPLVLANIMTTIGGGFL